VWFRLGLYGMGVCLIVLVKIFLILRWFGVVVGELVDSVVMRSCMFLLVLIFCLFVFCLIGVVGVRVMRVRSVSVVLWVL